jgi:tetratricopeptide (TPR) repeat protein
VTGSDPESERDGIVAALDAGDVERALQLIDAGIQVAAEPAEIVRLRLMHGRLLALTGQPDLARAAFDAALIAARTSSERGDVLLALAELHESVGAIAEARTAAIEASALADEPLAQVSARHLLGRIERDHGDLADAVELLRAARARLLHLGADPLRLPEITLDLAIALRLAGDYPAAIALLEGLAADADSPMAARLLIQIGTTWGFAGEHDRALDAYARALPLLVNAVDRAIVRYNRAVVLRDARDAAAAVEELSGALEENAGADPRVEYDALLLLGSVTREQGDAKRSLDVLTQALEITDGEAHGRARLEIGATLAATGLFGLAIEELTAALALVSAPDERVRALRYRATAQREMGRVDLALADITEAVGLTADADERARGEATRATLLAALGQRRQALQALDAALAAAIDPGLTRELLVQRGVMAGEFGQLEQAIADLTAAAALAEEAGEAELHARVLADLGSIFVAVDEPERARDAFERAAVLAVSGPVAHTALLGLGNLLVALREPLDALAVFERAAAAAEDDRNARAAAFVARGSAALRWRRYAAADADFTRALLLQPGGALRDQAAVAQRTAQHQLRHVAELRETLTRTIAALDAPEYRARPLLERADLALSAGDHDAALIDATRALPLFRLKPERALAHARIALMHAQLGQCNEAIAHLRDAAALDPDRAWLREVRGDIWWQVCRGRAGLPAELLGSNTSIA